MLYSSLHASQPPAMLHSSGSASEPTAKLHTGWRPHRAYCLDIARLAVSCLHAELTLYPKPGLVSLIDNGSHADMDAGTFMRSMFALRHYFNRICQAGMADAPFSELKRLGIAAEQRMLAATGGVNTHRGAIFSLGLLCAAIGRARAGHGVVSAAKLRAILLRCWGADLATHTHSTAANTHGLRVTALYASGGARGEGALGLPSVFDVGLPALQNALKAGRDMRCARIDTLFALMAHISDSNVFHRGGPDGALTVRQHAQRFLALGGTAHPEWQAGALACHRLFVARKLSPGGAADLLAATCLVHAVVAQ